MFCMKCGKQIADDSKVCGYCGHKQPAQAASPAPDRPGGPAEPSSAAAGVASAAVPRAGKAVKPRLTTPGRIPLWGWITIAASLLVTSLIAIYVIGKPTTLLQLQGGDCPTTFHAPGNTRLELHYGYWGVRNDDFVDDNDSALSIRLSVNGEPFQGRRESPIRISEVPCQLAGQGSGPEWDETRVLYDSIVISLDPGTYDILVVWYLSDQVSDGYDYDGDGVLDQFGPGEVGRREFTLIVTE